MRTYYIVQELHSMLFGDLNGKEIKKPLLLGRKSMTKLDSILKSRDNKGPSIQSYGFSSGHVWMWELDFEES